jgi:hypothetical protein
MPALATVVHCGGLVGLAGQLEAAAVGRVQAGEHVEEGGLAGAVGADQAVDLRRARCVMPTSLERLQAAKALGDAAYVQDGICHRFRSAHHAVWPRFAGTCHGRARATSHAGAAA